MSEHVRLDLEQAMCIQLR